jgi:alcohol dehydrogenase class IV
MSLSFRNQLPRRIVFGRGASGELPAVLAQLGVKFPGVITDAGVASAGLLAGIESVLRGAGISFAVYNQVAPEPPFGCVKAACATLGAGIDGIVALGGGSVMDVAKLVAAVARDGRDASALAGINKVGVRPLPLVMLPTTAGTGSEATPVAVFTNEQTNSKVGVVDPCLVPEVAIVDPALTDSLPSGATAAAGIDALVHAIEAYIATVATPLARGLALEAVRHIGWALPAVCRDPSDHAARDAMAIGSNLAGVAFANSSCCAVHALALPVGGRFHIPHGILTGGLVGSVMRRNEPACVADFGALAQALGWAVPPSQFADKLEELATEIGVTSRLRVTAVHRHTLAAMAAEAVANQRLMGPNPVRLSADEVVEIYEKSLCVV